MLPARRPSVPRQADGCLKGGATGGGVRALAAKRISRTKNEDSQTRARPETMADGNEYRDSKQSEIGGSSRGWRTRDHRARIYMREDKAAVGIQGTRAVVLVRCGWRRRKKPADHREEEASSESCRTIRMYMRGGRQPRRRMICMKLAGDARMPSSPCDPDNIRRARPKRSWLPRVMARRPS